MPKRSMWSSQKKNAEKALKFNPFSDLEINLNYGNNACKSI